MSDREPTIADVLDAVAGLESRLDARLVKLRSELSARVDRVQDGVTTLRHEMEVHYGHVDEHLGWTRGMIENQLGVSREVGGLYKLVKTLQADVEELKKKPGGETPGQ